MDSRELEATAQLFGLSRGYLTVKGVIAWADRVILQSDSPAREVVDVSTVPNDRDELQRRLRIVAGTFNERPDRSAVLKSMRETLAEYPDRAGEIAAALLHLFSDREDEASAQARHVEYAFELADDHVRGDRASATAELREFLARWN